MPGRRQRKLSFFTKMFDIIRVRGKHFVKYLAHVFCPPVFTSCKKTLFYILSTGKIGLLEKRMFCSHVASRLRNWQRMPKD
jgi:hypothetical protein